MYVAFDRSTQPPPAAAAAAACWMLALRSCSWSGDGSGAFECVCGMVVVVCVYASSVISKNVLPLSPKSLR
jgi:hypothetical protein